MSAEELAAFADQAIAWLAHRLSTLHAGDAKVFDKVVVITDRVVLDQQLQDTIYQFEHKRGVVQKIDESSRQLAEALENAVPVIITTLQKFPFVSRQLLKMAEERGTRGTGTLPTRRCAVRAASTIRRGCGPTRISSTGAVTASASTTP